jgi:hypothetical protein
MVSRRVVTWTALVCVVFGVGCGPDQEPPEDADAGLTPFVSLEDYMERRADTLAREQCEVVYACEHPRDFALFWGWGSHGDLESCEESRGPRFEAGRRQLWLDGVASGAFAYDPVSAEACLSALEALDDPCTFEDSFEVLRSECAEVFEGQLAQGDACSIDEECSDGLRCASGADLACGRTCEPMESCGGETCGEGTRCVVFSGGGERCVPEVEPGGACDGDWQCVGETRCLSVGDATQGVCTARGARGQDEPCDGDDFFCEEGLVCDEREETCSAPRPIVMGDEGDACSVPDGEACALGLVCVFDASNPIAREGECGAPLLQGEPCVSPSECAGALSCVGFDFSTSSPGECGPLREDGEACVFSVDCRSNVCTDGVCGAGTCEE